MCRLVRARCRLPMTLALIASTSAILLLAPGAAGAEFRPRVSGEAGRDAVVVAEQILGRIHTHACDDAPDGPLGPLLAPRHKVIPAPHFDLSTAGLPQVRKEAG